MDKKDFDIMTAKLAVLWGVPQKAVQEAFFARPGFTVTDTPAPETQAKAIPMAGSRASIDELDGLVRKANESLKASAGNVAPVREVQPAKAKITVTGTRLVELKG